MRFESHFEKTPARLVLLQLKQVVDKAWLEQTQQFSVNLLFMFAAVLRNDCLFRQGTNLIHVHHMDPTWRHGQSAL